MPLYDDKRTIAKVKALSERGYSTVAIARALMVPRRDVEEILDDGDDD